NSHWNELERQLGWSLAICSQQDPSHCGNSCQRGRAGWASRLQCNCSNRATTRSTTNGTARLASLPPILYVLQTIVRSLTLPPSTVIPRHPPKSRPFPMTIFTSTSEGTLCFGRQGTVRFPWSMAPMSLTIALSFATRLCC
ncbi:hypothetical protein BT69DRAFT_1281540, partial [Atractiella rhizophila]